MVRHFISCSDLQASLAAVHIGSDRLVMGVLINSPSLFVQAGAFVIVTYGHYFINNSFSVAMKSCLPNPSVTDRRA
jgi:hypothetical protein